MANAKQCDICSKFYAAFKVDRRLGSYEFRDTNGVVLINTDSNNEELETCPECMEKIKAFIEGMKKE